MNTPPSDALNRFSNRVEYYVRSRPHYPPALLEFLQSRLGLRREDVVADVGSGTGILTQMLLKHGNVVYAIEPNEPMRRAAESMLANYDNFRSVAGTAEWTTLGDGCVDLITAGQAFHWFDPQQSRCELGRILRRGGWVVLAWNDRRLDRPAFAVAYERLVRAYNTDLDKINHRNVSKDESEPLARFFGGRNRYESITFENPQSHDWEGVRARLLSSSYMPLADDPRYEQMLTELREIFECHQSGGEVQLEYDTRVYFGRLDHAG